MKNLLPVMISLVLRSMAFCDTFVLGTLDLAGFPSENMPALGSSLRIEAEDCLENSSIPVWSGETVMGHIPARHRLAIHEMLRRGVQFQLRVVRHHAPTAPGRYLEVEVRAVSPDIRLLIPLVEAEAEEEPLPDEEWDG